MKGHARSCLFFLIVYAFSFLSTGTCFAGAWTMQKGKLYDRLAGNFYFADKEFNDDRERKDLANDGDFRDYNLNNYIEYGITDNITIINSIYYKSIKKDDDTSEEETSGIGDIDLAVKYKIREGSWGVLSTQALLKIPGPYDKDAALPLGNGQADVEIRLLYGRSLYPYIPGYCNFEVGYRWRFEDPSDEFRYLIEFGTDFTKKFYGRIKLDGIYSADNGEKFDESDNPTATNNFDLGKLDMALGYKLPGGWGFEIGYTPEIYGRNTASGATYTFAVIFQGL